MPMNDTTKITINGPYLLEGLLAQQQQPKGIALICHPHPLHQGTMHNKVVTTLARAAHDCGYQSLRFNFRGVGKSEGEYGEGIGELEDARAALAFLKKNSPANLPVLIMGFSFGGYIAAKLASELEPAAQGLITIAPALHYDNLQVTEDPKCPWLIIHGTADEIIPFETNKAWLKEHSRSSQLVALDDASHFFHGRLVELKALVVDFIESL